MARLPSEEPARPAERESLRPPEPRHSPESPESLKSLQALVELARGRPPRAGRTRIIAVDGPSGSGKTTSAIAIQRLLECAEGPDASVQVIHMDDLYPGWDGLADAVSRLQKWIIDPLARGDPAAYRRYDWHVGRYAEWHAVPAADWLVVEGVGSGSRGPARCCAALLWVEADPSERLRRGLDRDGETFAPHWGRWADQESALFAAEGTRERADLIIDTT